MENSSQHPRSGELGPKPAPQLAVPFWDMFTQLLAVSLAVTLVFTAATRPQAGSPDAYQYLDVASNLAQGQGVVQSVPGYNSARFPAEPTWPQPYTSQPPLYAWLGSLAIRAGAEPTAALATIAAVGVVLTWAVGAWLAYLLGGFAASCYALLGLAACSWSPTLTTKVWSDPLAIALSLLTLTALLSAAKSKQRPVTWAVAAGLFAGLGFLTRYVLGLLVPFGIAWLLCLRPFGSHTRRALLFATSAGALAIPLLVRNVAVSGGLLGDQRNPSTQDIMGLAAHALQFTWGRLPGGVQWGAAAVFAAFVAWLVLFPDERERARATITKGGALLPLWALAYVLALFAVRSRVHFDDVGVRLLAPALVTAYLLGCALFANVVQLPRRATIAAVAAVLLLTKVVTQVRTDGPPAPTRLERSESEFMHWLTSETPPGAVLIAEDGVDLAWALRKSSGARRRIVSFSPAPYMQPLTQQDLTRFASTHLTPAGPPLRVIVRGDEPDDAAWRRRYGDVIADAVAGRAPAGEGLVLERTIEGKRILRWQIAAAVRGSAANPH